MHRHKLRARRRQSRYGFNVDNSAPFLALELGQAGAQFGVAALVYQHVTGFSQPG